MNAVQLQGIAIQLGIGCPLRCAHCYVSASPEHSHVIPLKLIEKIVVGYSKFTGNYQPYKAKYGPSLSSNSKLLVLTGGEPFQAGRLREATLFATALALRHNMVVSVNTSAYFAKGVAEAIEVLRPFQGLGLLEISVDKFHQEFIPITFASNCAEAANKLNIPYQFAVQQNEWKEGTAVFEHLAPLTQSVCIQDFIPVGERNSISAPVAVNKLGGCAKVGNLSFDEYGDAYPCSSAVAMARRGTQGGLIPEFSIGSIQTQSFEEIIHIMFNRYELEIIKNYGPITAQECWSKQFPVENHTARTYCDACVDLHCNGGAAALADEPFRKLFELTERIR